MYLKPRYNPTTMPKFTFDTEPDCVVWQTYVDTDGGRVEVFENYKQALSIMTVTIRIEYIFVIFTTFSALGLHRIQSNGYEVYGMHDVVYVGGGMDFTTNESYACVHVRVRTRVHARARTHTHTHTHITHTHTHTHTQTHTHTPAWVRVYM
jgi:hypothetical protein